LTKLPENFCMKYTLYIANKNYSSWSLRPWVLMSELQIPFEERMAPFLPGVGASWSSYRAFSPTGRVPCLHDGNEVVWDSLAIAEYLAERHEGVWPSDAKARAWARCATAEMHSGFGALRNVCGMSCGLRVQLNEISPPLQRDIDRLAELWNEGLRRFGGPFLGGDTFGAVDAFYAPVAFRIKTYGLVVEGEAVGYAERLCALPSMQRWYADALKETWRDAEHEAEVRSVGEIIEDLRAV
jgi:glutathione S-transferase